MRWGRFAVLNYRGVPLPRVLGPLIASLAVATSVWVALAHDFGLAGKVAVGSSIMVFLVGLVDDLSPYGPRGLRQHLRWLLEGRVSTGALKMFVTAACALMAVAAQPPKGGGWIVIAGTVLVAGAANVWNGLDVAPGRALKYFILVGAAPVVLAGAAADPAAAGVLVGGVVAIPFDLRERAMLGDSGANLVGFTAGLCLYSVLPAWGVVLGGLVAVGLNVAADVVGFSKIISTNAPLRVFDGLGRLHPGQRGEGNQD